MTGKIKESFMDEAIKEALFGIENRHGGPFGCVIVKDGVIVGRGHNRVLLNLDSTAHGEVEAIRDAEKSLKTIDLSGCDLYTTGEPCPMCLFAIMWANIKKVYYGCTIKDNEMIGFRDKEFDKMVRRDRTEKGFLVPMEREKCLELFEKYKSTSHKTY